MFCTDTFTAVGTSCRAFVADRALTNRARRDMALSSAHTFVADRANGHTLHACNMFGVSFTDSRVRWTNLCPTNTAFLAASNADLLPANAARHDLSMGCPLSARSANNATDVTYVLARDR
jgi:hypothetical protein